VLKQFTVYTILYFWVHITKTLYIVRNRKTSNKDENLRRINKKSILLNNLEDQAIKKYCKKYRIDNQSKFMREAIMSAVIKKFSDDYPTLWDQPGITMQPRFRF
jgi:hypothetical protein